MEAPVTSPDPRISEVIGVVGAGTMGGGIAQLALEHGHEVVLYDVDDATVERGVERIRLGLVRRASKLGLSVPDEAAWVGERVARLRHVVSLEDLAAEVEWVIEAALEELGLKQTIFRALDVAAPPNVGLGTNTSSLSIRRIASATRHPERVLGLHFFNPAPLMRLVEVVAGPRTAPEFVERARALVEGWGRTAILTADRPGFIVNRVNRPFTLEALRIRETGRASVADIDRAVSSAGYPLGPFLYMDLVGLDVILAAATAIHAAMREPRLRPSPLQRRLVREGRLGRKTGRGFYRYDLDPPEPEPIEVRRRRGTGAPLSDDAIVNRIRLAIANEAFHALGEGVAFEADIDRAMTLGANHPTGPIAWARAEGLAEVRERLDMLAAQEGERFRPARALVEASTRPT